MELRPKIIYDDGKFTYIKFDKEIGTIVSLDKNNSPSNVNFHVDNCGVFVVHKVMTKIAITKNNENNKRATCITNLSFKTEEG
jgi:type IV secretory pathway VirB9-like protein